MDFAMYKDKNTESLQASYLQEEKEQKQKYCKRKRTKCLNHWGARKSTLPPEHRILPTKGEITTQKCPNIFHLVMRTHNCYNFCCCQHTTLFFPVLMNLDFTLISLIFLHFLCILLLFIKLCSISNRCFCIINKRIKNAHTEIWKPWRMSAAFLTDI